MYLSLTEIKEAFERHLMQYRGASLDEARLVTSEFPELLKNAYLIEKTLCEVEIDGERYEKRADRINFAFFPDDMLPPFEGETPEFRFYTYYNLDRMPERTMLEYARAQRLFQTQALDPNDFIGMDSFM